MPQIRIFLKYWLPVILWALVIFTFSTWPSRSTTEVHWQDFLLKKSAHIVEYAVLTLLLYRAIWNRGVNRKKAMFYSLILSVIYAGTDEFHQRFTPGRGSSIRDVIFDTIGSGIAIYFLWNLLPKAPKKLRKLAEDYQLI